MTSPQISLPLSKLAPWSQNVRKTPGADTALEELAASIASVGIINPLSVVARGKGYVVVAGTRRLAALKQLAADGRIDAGFAVPCMLTKADDALEISLAENALREAMHPADEFEAFLALSKQGMSSEDIGARFGCTPGTVARRLKLARVHTRILEAYRAGDLELDAVMAYAISDDTRRQLKVFKALTDYQTGNPHAIRSALTEGEVDASDMRVRFVTLQAYEAAGGRTRRDLFADADDESGIYLLDAGLLEDLATRLLAGVAESVQAEGWSWTEVRRSFDYAERARFRQIRQVECPLPAALQAEHDALDREQDDLYALEDPYTEAQEARLDAIAIRLAEIENARAYVWPGNILQVGGAVISLGHDGEPRIERGLLRPADAKSFRSDDAGEDDAPVPTETASTAESGLSQSLNESLTKHRTAAIGAELARQPRIALAALAHALACQTFLDGASGASCLQISVRTKLRARDADGPAGRAIEAEREAWLQRLPGAPDDLWTWCLEQDAATLHALLAFIAALSVDAVARRGAGPEHGHQLARALELQMPAWFRPTAENYFLHLSKAQIVDDLKDIGRGNLRKASTTSKREAAAFAERRAAENTDWLPRVLRTP